MRSTRFASIAVCLLLCWSVVHAADFPLTLSASAQASKGATTITTTFTIHVERVMNGTYRSRVTDALKFGGYPKFLSALRALPVIGTIQVENRMVEIRYVREDPVEKGSRLVLVADQPLFFLGTEKARAGYELTLVDVTLDAQGSGKGTITGAARVKPTPDGGIIIDDFASAPVEMTVRRAPGK